MKNPADALTRTRELFDHWAEEGAGALAFQMEKGHTPRVLPLLEEAAAGISRAAAFLDIGCGTGYAAEWLARRFPKARVTALDAAPAMARLARRRCEGLPNVTVLETDFMTFAASQPEGSLDFAFCMEVWYYIPELRGAPAALRRLLRPGARALLIMEYFREHAASHGWPRQYGFEAHLLSSHEWAGLFRVSGFAEAEARVLNSGQTLALRLTA